MILPTMSLLPSRLLPLGVRWESCPSTCLQRQVKAGRAKWSPEAKLILKNYLIPKLLRNIHISGLWRQLPPSGSDSCLNAVLCWRGPGCVSNGSPMRCGTSYCGVWGHDAVLNWVGRRFGGTRRRQQFPPKRRWLYTRNMMPHAEDHSLREITKILMKSHRVISKYAGLANLVPVFRAPSLQFCVTQSTPSSLTVYNYKFRPFCRHIKPCSRLSAKTGKAEQQAKSVSEKLIAFHLYSVQHFAPKISG
jgi:hypothetical protein